jgi:hypothetical protein
MITINEPNGNPYISIHDRGEMFAIQLHRYEDVMVVLDKRVIHELTTHLQDMVATDGELTTR